MSIDELRPVRPGRDRPSASDHNTMIGLLRGLSRSSGGDVMVGPDGQISMRRRKGKATDRIQARITAVGEPESGDDGFQVVPHGWEQVAWDEATHDWQAVSGEQAEDTPHAALELNGGAAQEGDVVWLRRIGARWWFAAPSPLRTYRITGSTPDDAEDPTQHTYTAREQKRVKTAAGYGGWQDVDGTDHTLYSLWEQSNESPEPIPDGTFVAATPNHDGTVTEWWIIGSTPDPPQVVLDGEAAWDLLIWNDAQSRWQPAALSTVLQQIADYDGSKVQMLVSNAGDGFKWVEVEECLE